MRLDSDSDDDDDDANIPSWDRRTAKAADLQSSKPAIRDSKNSESNVERALSSGPKIDLENGEIREHGYTLKADFFAANLAGDDSKTMMDKLHDVEAVASKVSSSIVDPSWPIRSGKNSASGVPSIHSSLDLGGGSKSRREAKDLVVKHGSSETGVYSSISDAIKEAKNGSVIEVHSGEYNEKLVIDKSLQIRGIGDGIVLCNMSGETIIACASSGVTVSGLRILQTGGDGSKRGRNSARCVEVFQGDLTLERCSVQSQAGSGVIVADSGVATLRECTLRGCGKCGLLVFDGGSLNCSDSVISGNGLYGMVVQNGGSSVVEGNRFGGNKHAGILVHGRNSVCSIRANDISTNGEMGVGVQSGAEVRLERNRITGNMHAGLFVDGEGSKASVKDSELQENGVRGIGVQSGAEVHVQGSRVSNNTQEGLFVSGARSRATMQDNDLMSNGTKGVGVQSSANAVLISNRIVKNLEEGVFVSDSGSQATIRDCNVIENGMKGVGVQSSGQADIDGNLIHNNHREGVYVSGEGSRALIQNNDITDNGVKGVGIQDGADVAVEGNRITGNQYVGVHVYGNRSRGIVRENDIRDNSLAAVVTENGGVVQSADNRIDGVHESELAIPSTEEKSDKLNLADNDLSFRGRELDISAHQGNRMLSNSQSPTEAPRSVPSNGLPDMQSRFPAARMSDSHGLAARLSGREEASPSKPQVSSRPSPPPSCCLTDVDQEKAAGDSHGEFVTRQNCRIGETLWVLGDAEEAKRLTDSSVGISWNEDMAECCGCPGEVVAILDNYAGLR
eukprot:760071-Hanusia_phi.AAC.2